MAGEISSEEYAQWMTPQAALRALANFGEDVAVSTMLRRLQMGVLRSVARVLSWRSGGALQSRDYVIIDADDWQRAVDADRPQMPFWAVGDITFQADDPYGLGHDEEVAAFGVRFDPEGIHAISSAKPPPQVSRAPDPIRPLRGGVGVRMSDSLRVAGAAAWAEEQAEEGKGASSGAPKKPPVTDIEARAWYAALPADAQKLGQKKLLKRLNDDFPGRKAVRKLVEPFTAGRRTGRPPRT